MSGAVGHKRVPKDFIENLAIPLPPLPEQKRIVAILDEAFEAIDAAAANAEKNLASARELFESYLNSIFTQKGWVEKRLGEFAAINYGYTAKASFTEDGPKFLRITDIQDGGVDWTTLPTCTITEVDLKHHQLMDGDIVFARTGATTGKSYLLSSPPKSVPGSYLIRCRLNDNDLLAAYVALYFQTRAYWENISMGTTGSAQGGFNASKLADLTIPKPPLLAEQRHIVAHCGALAAETQRLESLYRQKLAALAELKQSILQKAFAGELTAEPQAPSFLAGEGGAERQMRGSSAARAPSSASLRSAPSPARGEGGR
jgi:type I restriction enzyme S subunit